MTIAILANHAQKDELISKALPATVRVIWVDSLQALTMVEADAYFDLLFEFDHERIGKYNIIKTKTIFISSIQWTTEFVGKNLIRINAWPGMLKREFIEIAIGDERKKTVVERVFSAH
jgi:3-hydroxybutyryl-CoA dehydrogenase